MNAVKVLLSSLAAIVAAVVVVPLTILAGLLRVARAHRRNDDVELDLDDAI